MDTMDSSELETYGQPLSVKELGERAKEYNWNPRIGFKYWAREVGGKHGGRERKRLEVCRTGLEEAAAGVWVWVGLLRR